MNSKQLRAFQVVFEHLVPSGSFLCVGDLFSPGSAYLQLNHTKNTTLVFTEDLVSELPLEVFDDYRSNSACLVSSVFLGEAQGQILRHESLKPGASEYLGRLTSAKVKTPAQVLPQFRLPSAIHLGGQNRFVVNAVLSFAAAHNILCTLTTTAAALVTSDTANQFDWLNETFETVAGGTIAAQTAAESAFAIAVPKGSVDIALMQSHGARSLIHVTPAVNWLTSFKEEITSLPVGAMPRLGFYPDSGDGLNWAKPNEANTLYLVAPVTGSYQLLIEVGEVGSDLKDKHVAIVAGRSPIIYKPNDKSIELTIDVVANEIIPITFILPTWSYQEDHDRWVGIAIKSVALLTLEDSK
ncbi:hypothetical protein [uncultured Umboniibacter sp.]|uniref:hypothetical protein n=1 Tax=uncultured Umboniibacter sp. TaxID=1798917 RepID=UPI00262D87C4|nr:hypothetical protein [uncultured Umboniibacter sp.]